MNKKRVFLLFGLGITSGTILLDRFVVPLADWIAILLGLLAIVCFILSIASREYKASE